MTYTTYITCAVALIFSIRKHWKKRNDSCLKHRIWVRKELRNTISSLREIRQIGVTY